MKVGIIGLGAMGSGIAHNLLKKGFEVNVYDIRKEVLENFNKLGAIPMSSSKELAAQSSIVMTLLPMSPFDPTLEDQVLNGVLMGMKAGGIIIDCGNTSPIVAKKLYTEAKKKQISFIDAPVSGGPTGAENGKLSIMAGGDKEAIERAKIVFDAIGTSFVYVGPIGSGMMTKLINNIIVAINLASISESLVLSKKAGLDPETTFSILTKGAAQSWVLDNYGKGMLERHPGDPETEGGGFSGIKKGGRDKQLEWAMEIANELDVPMPTTYCVHELYKMARAAGKGGYFEPIIELLEEQTKVFFSKYSK